MGRVPSRLHWRLSPEQSHIAIAFPFYLVRSALAHCASASASAAYFSQKIFLLRAQVDRGISHKICEPLLPRRSQAILGGGYPSAADFHKRPEPSATSLQGANNKRSER